MMQIYAIILAAGLLFGFFGGYALSNAKHKLQYTQELTKELQKQQELRAINRELTKKVLAEQEKRKQAMASVMKEALRDVPKAQKETSKCDITANTIRMYNKLVQDNL